MTGLARWPSAVQRITITAWVGSMWGVGFLVVPALFAGLQDRALAGQVAGQLFHLLSYAGIACAGVLLLNEALRKTKAVGRWKFPMLVVVMLLVTLLGEFFVVPQMSSIQQQATGGLIPGTPLHEQFSNWHHVASALFVANSVLGVFALLSVEPDLLKRRQR